MRKMTLTVTTDGSGDATAYSPRATGKIHSITYKKPGASSYTDGVDFTVTNETTGEAIWTGTNVNATATVKPRAPVHSLTGTALVYAATDAVAEPVSLGNDRVKIVVASGGAAKVGTFYIFVD